MRFRYFHHSTFYGCALLALLGLGIFACQSQNGQGPEDGQGTLVAEADKNPCTSTEFKDHAGCQMVNTRFHGHLKVGNITVKGVVKNTFQNDGKIEAMRFYPDEETQTPHGEILTTYTPEGKIHIVTVRSDLDPPGAGDNIIDFQTTTTHSYNPDGSYYGNTVVSHKVPHTPKDPVYQGGGGPTELNPKKIIVGGGGGWMPNPSTMDNYLDLQSLDDNGLILDSHRLDQVYDAASNAPTQIKGHQIFNEYQNGKAMTSVMKVFDCPSQPAPQVGECFSFVYGPSNPLLPTQFLLHPNRVPHWVQTTTWQYDDKGRVSHVDVEVDGDPSGPNPQKPADDGKLDHEWWCDFEYDDSTPGSVVAAFPKEFEIFGLSKNDKLKSITCDDKQGIADGALIFDGWAYLHEVHQDVSGPEPTH